MLSALGPHESRAVELPGFGVAAPVGFGFTRWAYKDWLIGELEKEGGPVHLGGLLGRTIGNLGVRSETGAPSWRWCVGT